MAGLSVLGCADAEEGRAWAPLPIRAERPRVVIEAAGAEGAALESLLLYANELELEGIVVVDGARLLRAYGERQPLLARHRAGYPAREALAARLVTEAGAAVSLLMQALVREDPRPLWVLRWLDDDSPGPSSLRQALDRIAQGPASAYHRALGRLRILGDGDDLGEHASGLGLRIATGGDPHAFLRLVDTGVDVPHEPGWGGWGGRFVPDPAGVAAWWTLSPLGSGGWSTAIANDLIARRDAGQRFAGINHEPRAAVEATVEGAAPLLSAGPGPLWLDVRPGVTVALSGLPSRDPDGDTLSHTWSEDHEAGTFRGAWSLMRAGATASVRVPEDFPERQTAHVILAVEDEGVPPLTRYRRVILTRAR